MMTRLQRSGSLAAALLIGISACDSERAPVEPTPMEQVVDVEMTPESFDLLVGDTLTVQALPVDEEGTPVAGIGVTWSSSDPSIAVVSPTGRVRGVSEGFAELRATTGPVTGIATVQVIDPATPAPTITGMTPTWVQAGGPAFTLRVTGAHHGEVAVLMLGGDSVPTQRASGELRTSVPASAIEDAGEIEVRVVRNTVLSEPVVLRILPAAGQPGSVSHMVPAAVPAGILPFELILHGTGFVPGMEAEIGGVRRATRWIDASQLGVDVEVVDTWTPGNLSVALFAPNGAETARRAIAVMPSGIAEIVRDPVNVAMMPTEQRTISVRLLNAQGVELTGRYISFSSQNAAIASVVGDGTVTAVGVGTTQIRIQSGEQSAQMQVTVLPPPVGSVVIGPQGAAVLVGDTVRLQARTFATTGGELHGRTIVWSSDTPDLATVDADGLVTGRGKGVALIRATSEGREASLFVAVREFPAGADWLFDLRLDPFTVSPAVADTTWTEGTAQVPVRLYVASGEFLLQRVAGRWTQTFDLVAVTPEGRTVGTTKWTFEGPYTLLTPSGDLHFFRDGQLQSPAATGRMGVAGTLRVEQAIGIAPSASWGWVIR